MPPKEPWIVWDRDHFYVHEGPAVIRVGSGWLGYASGNRPCAQVRRSADAALNDARRLQATDEPAPAEGEE